tara:strand:+ start:24604 stop:25779 length:1176 start_codon:yes stop_codon:yes gene_type:complete
MKNRPHQIGVSGGGRTAGIAGYLSQYEGIQIRGGFDPTCPEKIEKLLGVSNNPGGKIYSSYEEMLADPLIDWVMVGSPNKYHCEQIVAAFRAGKNVFTEKPLALHIEECREITKAQEESNCQLFMGFCMRYARLYSRAKEILSSGKLGQIISIDANENINPGHGAYIMTNWRRYKDLGGPHILEKCSHDLDLINWFTDSIPRRVAAFGGNDYFLPKNKDLLDTDPAFTRLNDHWEPGTNPFTSEKTIEDNIVAILEYYNGVRTQFQATLSNTLPERRMYFHCTKGNLIIEQYSATLQYKALGDESPQLEQMGEFHDAHLEGYQKVHADGDQLIMKDLAETIRTGQPVGCGRKEGLLGSVSALMVDEARQQGQVLDLSEVWNSLGIEPLSSE